MIKVDIISGFLGAGKTTLIKELLKDGYNGQQVVLIENEFGEIGIDGGFLKDAGIEIREMNSGCICCSLVGDFGTALAEVAKQYHPDRIVIEPSGVGKLSDVINAVEKVKEEAGIVINSATTVVDVLKCKMYMKNFGEFFKNQVEAAGAVILSRTDTEKATQAKVEETIGLLRGINPTAVIITTPVAQLGGSKVLEAMEGVKVDLAKITEEEEHHHHHHHHDHEGHEDHHHHDHEDHHHHDHEGHEHHYDENGECSCGHHHDEEHEHHHHHDHEGHEHHHHDHEGHEHHYDENGECSCGHHHDEEHEHHHHHDHEGHEHHHDHGEHHHHEGHEHHHDHGEHHHHEDGECCCGHDHHDHHHHHHHADEVFTSWGRETVRKYTKEKIHEILEALSSGEYGIVLRAKGMVAAEDGTWIYFDMVPEEADVREGAPEFTGRLCVIGSKLKEEAIAELFGLN